MRAMAGLLIFLATGAACAAPGAQHSAAVAFWTSGYAGADLASRNFHCPAPVLPPLSHTLAPAHSVRKAIDKWEQCHAGYLAALHATPAETRIPGAVLASMSPSERERARAHVRAVQARVLAAAQANAAAMTARHASWLGARVEQVRAGDD